MSELEWLRSRMSWLETQLAKRDEVILEQQKLIKELQKENEQLRKELRKYKNPNTPSGSVPPYLKDELKKTIEGITGTAEQRRYTEPKENSRNSRALKPDHKEMHTADCCPCCGGKLRKKRGKIRRMVIHFTFPKAENVLHESQRYWCPECRKDIVPKAPDTLPNSKFSLDLSIFIVLLSVGFFMSERKIAEFLKICGVDMSDGTVNNVIHRVNRYLGSRKYLELAKELKKSVATYSDETGARHKGKLNWTWLTANAKAVFIRIEATRAHRIANKMPLGQTNVNDGYRAYDGKAKDIQRCWAHPFRSMREPEYYFHSEEDIEQYKVFVEGIARIFVRAKQMKERSTFIREQFDAETRAFLLLPRRYEKNLEKVRNYMLQYEGDWFTFLKRFGIEPTNNRGERAIRPFVIKRKISLHTWSDEGRLGLAIDFSLQQTCRLRNESFMDLVRNEINHNLSEMEKS